MGEPSSSAVDSAKDYSEKRLKTASKNSKTLIKQAKALGKADAEKALPKALKGLKKLTKKAQAKAAANKKVIKAALKKAEAAALAEAQFSPFRPLSMKPDKRGVFGAVNFGTALGDSNPSSRPTPKSTTDVRRSAIRKLAKFANQKDIYGRPKACLKDIAAHFDEKDIYEQKKLALVKKAAEADSAEVADKIRKKLANLEMWHAMMQKKFMASAAEHKAYQRKMERLFSTHLPAALKKQLDENKLAKRAGQKLPHPGAMKQAMSILKGLRSKLRRDARLKKKGYKKMVRPVLNDPEFPSMDPISTHLRGRLWRTVYTEDHWSTDDGDLEVAGNLVDKAFQQHGDFVNGPIAEPLLKGKLYEAKTEPLGVPNFLVKFPWPKTEEKVTMDDKVKVEQTDFTPY